MRVASAALVAAAVVAGSVAGSAAAQPASSRAACVNLYYGSVTYCAFSDGSVSVKNISFSVVDVIPRSLTTRLAVVPAKAASLSDYLAERAAPTSCGLLSCQLQPGRSLVATDATTRFFMLDFKFDLARTVSRNVALTLTGMVVDKFQSPGRGLAAAVANCASRIGGLADAPGNWQSSLRTGFSLYSSCSSVAKALREAPDEEATFSKQAIRWAKSLTRGAWIDEMFELFGRVAHR